MTFEDIDEHIERLRGGGTLTENEVKKLCDKVRSISNISMQAKMQPAA